MDISSLCIGILLGMPIGVVAWVIGQAIMFHYQRKHGCFDVCYHCGKPPFGEEVKDGY